MVCKNIEDMCEQQKTIKNVPQPPKVCPIIFIWPENEPTIPTNMTA